MAALRKAVALLPSCKCAVRGTLRSPLFTNSRLDDHRRARLYPGIYNSFYLEHIRPSSSFLTHLNADALWKGVTTVSNPGKKKGRGKGIGKKVAKDLNKGQFIGVGKINAIWPGLNASVIKGKEIVEQQLLPPNPNREEDLHKLRYQQSSFRRLKLDSLQRGFSGLKWPGRSCGPPDAVKEGTFEGFDCKVLEFRSRSVMSGKFGRQRRTTALVIAGNKNGLAGFGCSIGKEGATTLRRAKNLAGRTLRYIERYDNHTVVHDFHVKYNYTELFVQKKQKGYGIVCNRFLKVICELIGLTDIKILHEGSKNPYMMTQAFFLGLKQQKTHQELADMIGLNVVELREECDNFPRLIAAPKLRCRTREEIPENEVTDYDEVINEGRVSRHFGSKRQDLNKQKKRIYERNHQEIRYKLLARYGDYKSFLHLEEEKRANEQKVLAVTEKSEEQKSEL